MKRYIGFVVIVALAAFALWWPLGRAYALFTALCGVVLGAWMRNSGLAAGLLYLTASLAMGVMMVVSLCIGAAPGAGTFSFGWHVPSVVLTLPSYGAAQAHFNFGVLFGVFVPAIVGAQLGSWLERRLGKLQAAKFADANVG